MSENLQQRVKDLMDHRGMTQGDLAQDLGMSRGVISQWLAGNYAHGKSVESAVEAWIARQTQGGAEFIKTRAAAKVFEACEFALTERRISLIVGRPGLGKTVALKEWHRKTILDNNEIIYHYCSPLIRPASLAKMLARRLGLSESGTAHDLLESVMIRLRRKPVPLLFDEANHLNVGCLEMLRYLHDSVGIGIVLCGSVELQRTLCETTDRHLELEQLQSRIGLRVSLQPLTVGEVRKFLAAKLGKDVPIALAKTFHDLSRGVLRDLVNGIDNAKKIAVINDTKTIDTEVVTAAFERQLMAA